jgi:hypothetical protein
MFKMNRPFTTAGIFKGCILLCICLSLLFALSPSTDFDLDGQSDSFVTDGLILDFVASTVVVPVFLFGRFLTAYLTSPRFFASQIVLPPIA